MNDLETRLSSMLTERAQHSPPAPEQAAILGRADRIRKRRTALTAAGVVAGVALAIGVPYAALDQDAAPRPAQPTPSSSPTPERPTPSPAPAGVSPALSRLDVGAGPAIAWWTGTEYHGDDGQVSELPAPPKGTEYYSVMPFRGGWITTRSQADTESVDGTSVIEVFGADGRPTGKTAGSTRIVASGDGTQLVWWTDDGTLHVEDSAKDAGRSRTIRTGTASGGIDPLGVTSAGDVVYVEFSRDAAPTLRITSEGSQSREIKGFDGITAFDPNHDLIAGSTYAGNAEQGKVSDLNGNVVWESPKWRPLTFSKDGSKVLATSLPQGGANEMALLESTTGKVLVRLAYQQRTLLPWTYKFEDENNLIMLAVDAKLEGATSPSALIRWRPDGSVERATDVVTSDTGSPAIDIGTSPSY